MQIYINPARNRACILFVSVNFYRSVRGVPFIICVLLFSNLVKLYEVRLLVVFRVGNHHGSNGIVVMGLANGSANKLRKEYARSRSNIASNGDHADLFLVETLAELSDDNQSANDSPLKLLKLFIGVDREL